MKILITGGDGQLGKCLNRTLIQRVKNLKIETVDDEVSWVCVGRKELDITDRKQIAEYLDGYKPDIVINCAAYTNVDKAEINSNDAYSVNVDGVCFLKAECEKRKIYIIHISTDYVFDGQLYYSSSYGTKFYEPTATPKPLGVYGKTKWIGEQILSSYDRAIIIRTSWLYSNESDNNFFARILKKLENNEDTKLGIDYMGTPTYAMDLANVVTEIVLTGLYVIRHGIWHYANRGCTTRLQFVKDIRDIFVPTYSKNITCDPQAELNSIDHLVRPLYSPLDSSKIYDSFGLDKSKYERKYLDSLKACFEDRKKKPRN